MLKKLLVYTMASFLALSVKVALADDMPNQPINLTNVIKKLQTLGYNNIEEIKFDDGILKVETINAKGEEIKLRMDPQNYNIVSSKTEKNWEMHQPKPAKFSMLDVIQKLESGGYHNIYKIEYEDTNYKVKALDQNNKKVELKINANTGEINKEKRSD